MVAVGELPIPALCLQATQFALVLTLSISCLQRKWLPPDNLTGARVSLDFVGGVRQFDRPKSQLRNNGWLDRSLSSLTAASGKIS